MREQITSIASATTAEAICPPKMVATLARNAGVRGDSATAEADAA
jgi:hypothetical protein